MAKIRIPYPSPIPFPIRPIRPIRPFPIPFPLPPIYTTNIHPCPDRQECEIQFNGVIYDGKTGRPLIDLNNTY
jgi:hypothetical protein